MKQNSNHQSYKKKYKRSCYFRLDRASKLHPMSSTKCNYKLRQNVESSYSKTLKSEYNLVDQGKRPELKAPLS